MMNKQSKQLIIAKINIHIKINQIPIKRKKIQHEHSQTSLFNYSFANKKNVKYNNDIK